MKKVKLTPIGTPKPNETPDTAETREDSIDKMVSLFIIPSFELGSTVIFKLLTIGILRTPTVNDLCKALGIGTMRDGDDYGWPDLYLAVVSCDYGVTKQKNPYFSVSSYSLRLPKVSKLLSANKEEA